MSDKDFFGELLGKAETAMGGIERMSSEGLWTSEEIIDAESGDRVWNVSDDGTRRIQVKEEKLALRVCELLNQ